VKKSKAVKELRWVADDVEHQSLTADRFNEIAAAIESGEWETEEEPARDYEAAFDELYGCDREVYRAGLKRLLKEIGG
jgi:hypothetical protein